MTNTAKILPLRTSAADRLRIAHRRVKELEAALVLAKARENEQRLECGRELGYFGGVPDAQALLTEIDGEAHHG